MSFWHTLICHYRFRSVELCFLRKRFVEMWSVRATSSLELDTLCRRLVAVQAEKWSFVCEKSISISSSAVSYIQLTAISDDVSLVYLKLYFSE